MFCRCGCGSGCGCRCFAAVYDDDYDGDDDADDVVDFAIVSAAIVAFAADADAATPQKATANSYGLKRTAHETAHDSYSAMSHQGLLPLMNEQCPG